MREITMTFESMPSTRCSGYLVTRDLSRLCCWFRMVCVDVVGRLDLQSTRASRVRNTRGNAMPSEYLGAPLVPPLNTMTIRRWSPDLPHATRPFTLEPLPYFSAKQCLVATELMDDGKRHADFQQSNVEFLFKRCATSAHQRLPAIDLSVEQMAPRNWNGVRRHGNNSEVRAWTYADLGRSTSLWTIKGGRNTPIKIPKDCGRGDGIHTTICTPWTTPGL